MMKIVSVVGESIAEKEIFQTAIEVGKLLAKNNIAVCCGGLKGVMEAVCKGAKSEGGLTIGILPYSDRNECNKYVDIPIVTGLGFARNSIVVKTGQVVIAVGGWYGTLCEIAYALDEGKPIIGIDTWEITKSGKKNEAIIMVKTPEEAVKKAIEKIDLVQKLKKL